MRALSLDEDKCELHRQIIYLDSAIRALLCFRRFVAGWSCHDSGGLSLAFRHRDPGSSPGQPI